MKKEKKSIFISTLCGNEKLYFQINTEVTEYSRGGYVSVHFVPKNERNQCIVNVSLGNIIDELKEAKCLKTYSLVLKHKNSITLSMELNCSQLEHLFVLWL